MTLSCTEFTFFFLPFFQDEGVAATAEVLNHLNERGWYVFCVYVIIGHDRIELIHGDWDINVIDNEMFSCFFIELGSNGEVYRNI